MTDKQGYEIKLQLLLHDLVNIKPKQDVLVRGLCLDSRAVTAGDLFFAYPGRQTDGRDYIDEAIVRGAAVILADGAKTHVSIKNKVPIITVPKLSSLVSSIAARFYQAPSEHLKVLGVTGTNGKTTTTQLIAHVLEDNHVTTGVMGTLGYGLVDQLQESGLTTLDAIALQAGLNQLQRAKAKVVAMEVSSHALDQGRTNAVTFEGAVFTNLTRDHLDYHGDMQAYAEAKLRLFERPELKFIVVNADDVFGQEIARRVHASIRTLSYSTSSKLADVIASDIQCHATGVNAHITSPWGEGDLLLPLLGRFNLSNALAALTSLCLLELPFAKALASLALSQAVHGRMQVLQAEQQASVVVDYAHTPDSLQKALMAIREHWESDIWCVFGCGGERDKGKRAEMAKVAEKHADHIIVTNDNPRHEAANAIFADIKSGFQQPEKVLFEQDRARAIQIAIDKAKANEVVLIAGKGHEQTQQIGEKKRYFSDVDFARQCLSGAKSQPKADRSSEVFDLHYVLA